MWRAPVTRCAIIAGLSILSASSAWSQAPEADLGWKDTAELSYVLVGGNAEASSLGFKNTLSRKWQQALFTLRAAGVRVETTSETISAVGTPADFDIVRDESTETTAENYLLHGRYDREITERFFWYAGTGWERNRFAGIENRYGVQGGLGNIWYDADDLKLRTDYALSYTDQEDVVDVPGLDTTFLGLRLSYDYLNKLGVSTTFTSLLIVDDNLEETSDVRADFSNGLAVAMNERLALKLSLQLLFDNEPAFVAVPLVPPPGAVFVELDDLDTVFTTSLVVNF